MAASLLFSLILLSFLSLSSPLPSSTILDASEILSDSGYVSMALTLDLVSQTLTQKTPSLTIFAPVDDAFKKSGQPALSLLRYHFCPLTLPPETLKSLPSGTKIPTMLPGRTLTVTNSPSNSETSLNKVKISRRSPIFDDGSLIIFGVQEFFDPSFQAPGPGDSPRFGPRCNSLPSKASAMGFPGDSWFKEASGDLRSNGYSAMASFLDSQLLGFNKDPTTMTVFAPNDMAMANRPTNQVQDPSIFLRHVVPCKLLWSDLINFTDGTVLPTYLDGFTITITRSGSTMMLNGVTVFTSNLHYSDSVVVHGLNELLNGQATSPGSGESKTEDDTMLNTSIQV
ncbi:putative fasciclin-like arabinogalactan protein 20 [Humulus lupulus]|uniref:putative fasciclin-like arabinogalactan protein 20 n=1 Tax=Humulus lupulus TaxID=3486 RepID=UPI002B404B50|nr:putative fasciclin-like arabinogalactan protein 20 [Humulus lupulus]